MSEPTVPEFVSHCDEPSCDLGYVEYACPACGRPGADYGDCWFERDRLWAREVEGVDFACEHCEAPLVMRLGGAGYPEIALREPPCTGPW